MHMCTELDHILGHMCMLLYILFSTNRKIIILCVGMH